ncbi:hypothetical protein FTT16_08445 [Campylobacter jejuni]|nr:hypothetical protein [Campylobacter jejuni]
MKKILFIFIAIFFIACGDDKLVKFEYEKGDKKLFDYANKLIEEKYPGYNFYSWKSLENIKSIKDAKYRLNQIEDTFSKKLNYDYYNYILLEKNKRYKLIKVLCLKARKSSNPLALVKEYPDSCEIHDLPIIQE